MKWCISCNNAWVHHKADMACLRIFTSHLGEEHKNPKNFATEGALFMTPWLRVPHGPHGLARAVCDKRKIICREQRTPFGLGMECCTGFGDLKPVIKDHVSLIPADNSCFVCGSVHLSGWRPLGTSWTPNPYRFWLKDTWGCSAGMGGTSANCTNKISMAEPRWACLGCCHQTGLIFFRCYGAGWQTPK